MSQHHFFTKTTRESYNTTGNEYCEDQYTSRVNFLIVNKIQLLLEEPQLIVGKKKTPDSCVSASAASRKNISRDPSQLFYRKKSFLLFFKISKLTFENLLIVKIILSFLHLKRLFNIIFIKY